MAEDQIFTERAAGQHAVAAFEAIAGYARERLRPWTADSGGGGREPAQDHYRLSGMLCALRHLTGKYAEISFRSMLEDSNQEYRRQRADPHRALPAGAAAAARAIDACHRSIDVPAQFRGSAWPPDALAGLREYAAWAGRGFPAAIGSITGQLITDLWHYADRQHIDFGTAMTAADQAYARQRLAAEGPFQTGLDPGQHPAAALTPSPAAPASGLIATRQGIVTSFADAEWLLVRTAARTGYQARNVPASSYEPDEDDLLALSRALGGMCGQSAGQIVSQLTPRIEVRIAEIERGPDTAAELGREHGQAGTGPFCDLDIDGDATALMRELGETEPMTGASYPYRLNLVTAHAEAYRQASTQGPAAAASPARIAAEGFPATPAGLLHLPGRPPQTLPLAGPRPGRAAGPGTGRRDDRTRQDQQPFGDPMSTWTPVEALITRLATGLLGDLYHYSDRHGTGFWDAMSAGYQAYAAQRLGAEGPFQTGQDTSQSPPLLTPSPDGPAFELIATRQGVVTTSADAEWHLVRTAARTGYQARHAPEYPYHRDEDDLIALSRALGRMCGLPAGEIVRQLTPQTEARITEIEQGPDAAADLGREHGRAGTPPYCDPGIDGDATALMHAPARPSR